MVSLLVWARALQFCKERGACLLFHRMVQKLQQLAVALEVEVAWALGHSCFSSEIGQKQWFSALAAHRYHLENFESSWSPGSIPEQFSQDLWRWDPGFQYL